MIPYSYILISVSAILNCRGMKSLSSSLLRTFCLQLKRLVNINLFIKARIVIKHRDVDYVILKKCSCMYVAQMLNELEETTSEINGALVEDNRFCISVHYRHVLQEVQVKLDFISEIICQVMCRIKYSKSLLIFFRI